MKKHLKKILLVLFIGIILVTGCSKKKEEVKETPAEPSIDSKVIGTWEYNADSIKAVYVFEKNGTGSYTITVEENTVEKEVDYYTKNGILYINFDKDPDTFEMEYTMRDGDLIIKDSLGEELIYKKQ